MAPARSRSPRHALDALEFLAAGELLAALKDVAPTANGADSATRTRTAPPSPVGEVNEVPEEENEVEDETTQRRPHCDNTVLTSKLLSHWSSACPAVPWQCSECCAEVLKWKMRSHVCDRSTKAAGAEMPQAPKVPQVPMVLLVEALQVQSRAMRRQRRLAWRSEGTLSEGSTAMPSDY